MHGFTQLSNYTLCMTGVQGENDEFKHYDVHSLYGWSMAIPSQRHSIQIFILEVFSIIFFL